MADYNPSDAYQHAFLASLAQGESGGNYSIGWGGTDLSGYPVDQYGFPKWSGGFADGRPTHAAGAYQFQPGTWSDIASRYGLNFQKKSDQDAGAWYLAQERYKAQTGGDLETALQTSKFDSVTSALSSTWTSLKSGNLANGVAAELSTGSSGSTMPGWSDWLSNPLGSAGTVVTSYFVRGAMILVGVAILLIALWALLSQSKVLPDAVSLGS